MRILVLTLLILSPLFCLESKYISDKFTIEAPAWPDENHGKIVALCLPSKNGFSGNVLVMIQEFSGTIKEYEEVSDSQLKQMGHTVIGKKIDGDSLIYEYNGKADGIDAHWYIRAIKRDGLVYVVTATALEKDWNEQRSPLIKSVNSFRLKQ